MSAAASVSKHMKTRGLDQRLPPFSLVAGPPAVPGEAPEGAESAPVHTLCPGDFLLSRAHGFRHTVLEFGQRLRLRGPDKRYAAYTHAALVASASGEVIEAIGEGVRSTSLRDYVQHHEVYQVVHVEASEEDRRQIVDFARSVLDKRAPYAFLALLCTTLWAFTGCRLMFFMDGSYTCSGLVAEALVAMGARLGMSSTRVMPAQLAAFFHAPPPSAAFTRGAPTSALRARLGRLTGRRPVPDPGPDGPRGPGA